MNGSGEWISIGESHAHVDLDLPLTNCNHFTLPAMSRSREHQPDRTRSRAPERTAHLCVQRMRVIVCLFNWSDGAGSGAAPAGPRARLVLSCCLAISEVDYCLALANACLGPKADIPIRRIWCRYWG